MIDQKFLSIITISYNQRTYLSQTLASVLSQKSADIEYIVCDPGSTDGSRELLQAHADQIDHLIMEPDAGPADGLNKAFSLATGRYGYFINSDDFLLPGSVDRLRSLWKQQPDADGLLCGAWIVDSQGRPLREVTPLPVSLAGLAHGRTVIVQQGFSFSMAKFRQVGGFNPLNRTCWDHELLCAMLMQAAQFRVCNERIGAFRLHGDSLTGGTGGSQHWTRYQNDLARIYENTFGHPPNTISRLKVAAGPKLKYLSHPLLLLKQIADQMWPARIMQRWQRDSLYATTQPYPPPTTKQC